MTQTSRQEVASGQTGCIQNVKCIENVATFDVDVPYLYTEALIECDELCEIDFGNRVEVVCIEKLSDAKEVVEKGYKRRLLTIDVPTEIYELEDPSATSELNKAVKNRNIVSKDGIKAIAYCNRQLSSKQQHILKWSIDRELAFFTLSELFNISSYVRILHNERLFKELAGNLAETLDLMGLKGAPTTLYDLFSMLIELSKSNDLVDKLKQSFSLWQKLCQDWINCNVELAVMSQHGLGEYRAQRIVKGLKELYEHCTKITGALAKGVPSKRTKKTLFLLVSKELKNANPEIVEKLKRMLMDTKLFNVKEVVLEFDPKVGIVKANVQSNKPLAIIIFSDFGKHYIRGAIENEIKGLNVEYLVVIPESFYGLVEASKVRYRVTTYYGYIHAIKMFNEYLSQRSDIKNAVQSLLNIKEPLSSEHMFFYILSVKGFITKL